MGNEKWFVYPRWFAYPGFAYPMFVSLTMKEIWKLVLGNEKWFAYPMCSLIRGSLIQHRLYLTIPATDCLIDDLERLFPSNRYLGVMPSIMI